MFYNITNKNIFKQIYIDILKILNFSQIQIIKSIKKNNLYKDFYKLTSIVNIHLLLLILAKYYLIFSLEKIDYLNIEILICSMFFILESILIYKIIKETKYVLTQNDMKKIKFCKMKSNIIDISKYKNFNK